MKTYKYYIGIDVGVQTGFCVYCKFDKSIRQLATVKIHVAMKAVEYWKNAAPGEVFIRVEDPRKATYGRQNDIHKAQGAGSVKRDAKIWEDFLTDLEMDFEMCRPRKDLTKWSVEKFKMITKYNGATSEHSRDAATLVYGR